mgnify:CR=1 FL=1
MISSCLLRTALSLVLIAALAGCAEPSEPASEDASTAEMQQEVIDPDTLDLEVPYVPTPLRVVDRMLALAEVSSDDVVYDLGSGDGRIVIAAAERYGARGVGVEIDSALVARARQNAEEAGVADRVTFQQGDLFEIDLSPATAVTLYLLPSANLKLRPKLLRELAPGTPVVSHDFDMNEWTPEQTVRVASSTIYVWRVPDEVPAHLQE